MAYWLYDRGSDSVMRLTLRAADRNGRDGADAGYTLRPFVVDAADEAAALCLAREWVALCADDTASDVGDMALFHRPVRNNHSYAVLIRL